MSKRQNGKGTLRKRKDGRWEGRFNAGVDEKGKQKVKYVLAKTKAECDKKLKEAIELYERDRVISERCTFLTNPNPTLSEWSRIWLDSYCKGIIRDSTYENYEFFFERYLNPRIGDVQIRSLTTIMCQQVLMDLYTKGRLIDTSKGKAGTGYSLKTVKNVKIAFQACLQKAEDEDLIPKNPVKGVKLLKLQKKEMQTLKQNELSAFLNETIASDCYEFYFLEITTGLRLGEILALEWEDLDEKNKTIRVNKQVRRSKNGLEVSTPKTQASIRTISISEECLRLLKGLKNRMPVGTKLMFPSPVSGTYYDSKTITHRLHRIQKRAGVPQIRFHDLRHPYVKLKTKKFRDFWSKKPTFRITLSSAFVFAPSETNRARENLLLHSLFQFDCP